MNNKTLIFVILVLCSFISVVTALNTPYSLSGHVYDDASNPLIGTNITFTNLNSSEVIYYDSTSGGEYQQDAANFASGYFDGDIIKYYSIYGASTNTTNESITVANGGTLLDIYITLVPAPHMENNTDYYISYYYTVGVASAWNNMSDAAGKMGESSVPLIGMAIILLIMFAALDWLFIRYLWDKKE